MTQMDDRGDVQDVVHPPVPCATRPMPKMLT
jgi:hypothetical protein